MRLHLANPLHGRREFNDEVGNIVIGVGATLLAEQAVEGLPLAHVV
jgi:hypothetical protein